MNAHARLFDRIARGYQWFFTAQVRYYDRLLADFFDTAGQLLAISPGARVLDIGCGTGALAKIFQDKGYNVLGIDVSPRMVGLSRQNGIKCITGDVISRLPFLDAEFDLVTAAFFLHGIPARERRVVLAEAARVSTRGLLLVDHNVRAGCAPWYVRLVEHIEGGDYRGFLQTGLDELQGFFHHVNIHEASKTTAIYTLSVPR